MRVPTRFGLGRAAVALAVLTAGGIGWAAPASAAPAGMEVITLLTAPNSADKSRTLTCPVGKVVTGGGGISPHHRELSDGWRWTSSRHLPTAGRGPSGCARSAR